MSVLPAPGEIVSHDFRPAGAPANRGDDEAGIKVVQWNIERGYELDRVIAELRALDGDVIALQEIDVGCERSASKDTGVEIAKALGLNYVFLCEFTEIESDLRDAASQGGGVHGNGILSRFDITDARAVEHDCQPVNWDLDPELQPHPLAAKEPRRGRRKTLTAKVHAPGGAVQVYCAHLEVFCGLTHRLRQLADIISDAKQVTSTGAQMILGDMNTMAHGIARLSPNYCCDHMRWQSLGRYEGKFWHDTVFSYKGAAPNPALLSIGLPRSTCDALMGHGFTDPFDPVEDVTLDNPRYRVFGVSLMTGKLDWVLCKGVEVYKTDIGNHDYSASDHKWLAVNVHVQR